MASPPRRRLALALTGASGGAYGLRLLEALARRPELEVHLTLSPAAAQILALECGVKVDLARFRLDALVRRPAARVVYHHHADLSAPLASGSFRLDALAIVPCSMECAGRMAHGVGGDLIERAADVMLKERRRLVLVPRETPLSAVHLENLLTLARLGAVVLPAAPGFYGHPTRVAGLVDFVVARVLDHLAVPHQLGPRWGEAPPGAGAE